MKKQNKNVKTKKTANKVLRWLETPEGKYDKKLPKDMVAISALSHDLVLSILVVSLLINLTLFASWLVLQSDPSLELAVISLK